MNNNENALFYTENCVSVQSLQDAKQTENVDLSNLSHQNCADSLQQVKTKCKSKRNMSKSSQNSVAKTKKYEDVAIVAKQRLEKRRERHRRAQKRYQQRRVEREIEYKQTTANCAVLQIAHESQLIISSEILKELQLKTAESNQEIQKLRNELETLENVTAFTVCKIKILEQDDRLDDDFVEDTTYIPNPKRKSLSFGCHTLPTPNSQTCSGESSSSDYSIWTDRTCELFAEDNYFKNANIWMSEEWDVLSSLWPAEGYSDMPGCQYATYP